MASCSKQRWRPPLVLNPLCFGAMREGGLEPPHLAAPEPKSGVSANFTTLAKKRHTVAFWGCIVDGKSNFSLRNP